VIVLTVDKLRDHIERLLEDRNADRSDDVRGRLKADFAEGLGEPGRGETTADDPARTAAFIDGRLSGSEREAFLAELARDPARRADLESAAELVSAMDQRAPVPPHLMTWAQQLGPSPAPTPIQEAVRASLWDRIRSFELLPSLSRRHRPVWAGVAAVLLVAVVGSGVLMHEQGAMRDPAPAGTSPNADAQFRSVDPPQRPAAQPPAAQPPASPSAGGSVTAARPQPAPPPAASGPTPKSAAVPPPAPEARASRQEQLAPTPLPPGAALGGPFRLTDQNGRPVSDQDLKGRPFLVFFGSINSPEASTAALSEMSELLRTLGPDTGKINALFVTVDPERDTPDKLKAYLTRFDPRLRGLTGDPAAVDAMLKAYQVYSRKVAQGSSYVMAHTTLVYLMDKQGRFVAPFNLKRPAGEAAAELRRYF
jgi:protein SCO1/2